MSATSRAGSTTDSVDRLRSSSSSSGNSACSKERITPRVLWRTGWPSPASRCPGSRFSTAARARSWSRGRRSAPRTRSPSRCRRPCIPSCARRSIAPASTALYAHQADALASAYEGAHDRHHGHGERQVAGVQPAGARHAQPRPLGARALPLPHQGAGAGPGARAARAEAARAAARDLRRRHAARGAPRDPREVEPDPHQPRHAARRRAAQPPPLGRRAGQPRLDRGRRGARLPRRVRLARGQRAAAAAARWRSPTAPSRGSCWPRPRSPTRWSWPSGSPAATWRWWTARARRGPSGGSRCGTRRSPTSAPGARGSPLAEAADLLADLVEKEVRTICFLRSRRGVELIQRFARQRLEDRGRADLAELIAPYRAGYTPVAAARDRAAAGGRRAAGGGVHRRARAGHRHRRPRRGDLRDLPRHRGQPAPDVGPRRAPRHRPGAVRGRRRRARPVLLPPPRGVPRAARWSRRSSTTSPRRSSWPTWRPRPTSCRSRRATRSSSATAGSPRPGGW